ncbi:hypothetical protein SAMN05421837_108410 [Amycolatopsis pretoriensis]|uniref:Uncharacterized protein n=1 Tax=Amycolatopsis pretoriensis TaxID=218821 RepID=A0A1H5RBR2_9PSEU|nr:hypothetical protein SAMN05421837_108410 [Amycolatopsis pretoriensis]
MGGDRRVIGGGRAGSGVAGRPLGTRLAGSSDRWVVIGGGRGESRRAGGSGARGSAREMPGFSAGRHRLREDGPACGSRRVTRLHLGPAWRPGVAQRPGPGSTSRPSPAVQTGLAPQVSPTAPARPSAPNQPDPRSSPPLGTPRPADRQPRAQPKSLRSSHAPPPDRAHPPWQGSGKVGRGDAPPRHHRLRNAGPKRRFGGMPSVGGHQRLVHRIRRDERPVHDVTGHRPAAPIRLRRDPDVGRDERPVHANRQPRLNDCPPPRHKSRRQRREAPENGHRREPRLPRTPIRSQNTMTASGCRKGFGRTAAPTPPSATRMHVPKPRPKRHDPFKSPDARAPAAGRGGAMLRLTPPPAERWAEEALRWSSTTRSSHPAR